MSTIAKRGVLVVIILSVAVLLLAAFVGKPVVVTDTEWKLSCLGFGFAAILNSVAIWGIGLMLRSRAVRSGASQWVVAFAGYVPYAGQVLMLSAVQAVCIVSILCPPASSIEMRLPAIVSLGMALAMAYIGTVHVLQVRQRRARGRGTGTGGQIP